MKKYKNLENGLWIIYGFMIIICVLLNIFNANKDTANIIISIIMFAVVGFIFKKATTYLKQVKQITEDLKQATAKMKADYENQQQLLWNQYKVLQPEELFATDTLRYEYQEYLMERQRLEAKSNSYKCKLSDYINEDYIDGIVRKNILNIVPGVMTGLGILGTFVGLSLGLQHFDTGNSTEIEQSIAPLMDGIKVAFHTSIYGMTFSLISNFIFKKMLEDAYNAVNGFLQAFDKYVDSNAETDNNSMVQQMLYHLPERIGEKFSEVLTPVMDRMNNNLEEFTKNMSETQIKGVASIVNKFVNEMNTSLGESFQHLGEIVNATCNLQEKNNELMRFAFEEAQTMTGDIKEINALSNKTVENMSGFVEKMENLQGILNESFTAINGQLEGQKDYNDKLKEYMEVLVVYERQIGEASRQFSEDMSEQLGLLHQMENKISESTRENLEMLTQKAEEYNKILTEAARNELQSILSMATEYSQKVTEHINGLDHASERLTENADSSLRMLSENAQKYNHNLSKSAENQLQQLLSISTEKAGEMERAARELSSASQTFNHKLENSIQKTFVVIDESLSEITKHLSGTIAEIDDSTNRVPIVISEAYKGLENTFKEMKTRYSDLNKALETMAREIEGR